MVPRPKGIEELDANQSDILRYQSVDHTSLFSIPRIGGRVGMYGVTDRPGIASAIFTALADANINVDMIVQTRGLDGTTDLDFTVPTTELEQCKKVMTQFMEFSKNIDYNEAICKVSIVGVGMKSNTGVASKAFTALANENINIRIISTSEIKISMIIDEKYAELAVRALHDAYELDK